MPFGSVPFYEGRVPRISQLLSRRIKCDRCLEGRKHAGQNAVERASGQTGGRGVAFEIPQATLHLVSRFTGMVADRLRAAGEFDRVVAALSIDRSDPATQLSFV